MKENADFEEVPASDRNPNLPNDYTQITYISSSGIQWVDTGFVPTINTRIEIEFEYLKLSNYTSIGGISLGNRAITIEVEGKSLFTKFNTGSTWFINNGAIIDHKYSLMLSNATRELDGTVYNDSKAGTWMYNSTYTYALFGVKTWGNNCSNYSSAKIYSFKLYDLDENNEEEKKLDFIPVITSDGVFGFFDIVGQTFYGNSGSGSFNLGNLQGDGTENTPYEISDAGELATMIAYSKPNAYYVLSNDISFNDGYFEPNDDGTCTYHDGGDGILYDWTGNIATKFKQLDGQNHILENFYSSSVGLFCPSSKCSIFNLNMSGGYIETNRGTGFVLKNGYSLSEELTNVRVDGVLYSTYSGSREYGGSGLIIGNENYARSILKNCVTRGKITAPSAGGIGRLTSGIFENCVNYAEVYGGAYAGGILAACWHATPDITFTNCKNYGKITGTTNVAGITSGAVRAIFRNCVNYGIINSTNGIASGILATQMNGGNFDFYSCGNEGQITGKNGAAGICYNCGTYRTVQDCYNKGDIISSSGSKFGLINGAKFASNCFNYGSADGMFGGISQNGEIRDCKNYGKVVTGLVGTLENNAVMINCANKYQGSCTRGLVQTCSGKIYRCVNESNARYGLVETLNGTGGIYNCESNGVTTYYIANKINVGGEVKNCHFTGDSQRAVGTNNGTLTNIVYEGTTKQYYGSDFSGFYVKWKTGYIGLKALDSVGVYMFAIPNEEYLQERGFTKAG